VSSYSLRRPPGVSVPTTWLGAFPGSVIFSAALASPTRRRQPGRARSGP